MRIEQIEDVEESIEGLKQSSSLPDIQAFIEEMRGMLHMGERKGYDTIHLDPITRSAHAQGEMAFKLQRFINYGNPDDLVKLATWAALAYNMTKAKRRLKEKAATGKVLNPEEYGQLRQRLEEMKQKAEEFAAQKEIDPRD